MSLKYITDPSLDDDIRERLRAHDRMDGLATLAWATGIAGGSAELRKIMDSKGELSIIDRGMLGMHLNLVKL